MEIAKILSSKDKTTTTTTGTKYATIIPVDPIGFKFLYAKKINSLKFTWNWNGHKNNVPFGFIPLIGAILKEPVESFTSAGQEVDLN